MFQTRKFQVAALLLTPAALLAACSSTRTSSSAPDYSQMGDTAETSRTERAADRRYMAEGSRNSRTYYNHTGTQSQHQGWYDGQARTGNANPSNDNSAAAYNTGQQRPIDPATGTNNDQNNGTVGTTYWSHQDSRWTSQDPRWSNQDQNGANRAYSNSGTNPSNANRQYGNTGSELNRNSQMPPNQNWANNPNSNPANDNGAGAYDTGNANADRARWNNQEQNAASRANSNPNTNPSNANAQYGNTPSSSDPNRNGQVPPVQNWTNAQDQQRSGNLNNENNGYNNGQQRQINPSTGTNNNQNNGAPGATGWATQDQIASSRANADPATNPSNANAQFENTPSNTDQRRASTNPTSNPSNPNGQPDSTSASAGSSRGDMTDPMAAASARSRQNQPETNSTTQRREVAVAETISPDSRILSILHMKDQKEIELGKLAKSKGSTEAITRYGDMLVKDHSDADGKVVAIAAQSGVRLLSADATKQMLLAEGVARGESAAGNSPKPDTIEQLRNLSSTDFDRAFAQKMVESHHALVLLIEDAQPKVTDARVRKLLAELLPTIRAHEKMARELPGGGDVAKAPTPPATK